MTDPEVLVAAGLADPDTGWSIGGYGAIAEFHPVAGDPMPDVVLSAAGGTVRTERGAVHVALVPGVQVVEGRDTAICVDAAAGSMNGRDVLTELGPDDGALRPSDRGAVVFDLGLGLAHVDFCVRTDDSALIDVLRSRVGSSLLDTQNPVMDAVKEASPHRVAVSRIGRIEVYQPIASRSRGVPLPEGPHTHVLPLLLARKRGHPVDAPVPDGWVVGLAIHRVGGGH